MTTPSFPDTLSLSRTVLRILIALNCLMAFGILALLVASFISPHMLMRGLGISGLIVGVRIIMVLGILGVGGTHLALSRLLTIVETVRVGDPFSLENAERLRTIAWSLFGLEALRGTIVQVARSIATPIDIEPGFSFSWWLAILLCFVLARVFEQGVRMREDLEGTV